MANCGKVFCRICKKGFENAKSLTNHLRWHDLPQYREFQQKYREYCKIRIINSETKQKISRALLENKNGNWRGDKVQYAGLHGFVKRRKKQPEKCEDCGRITNKLDLANISQEYKRDLDDWEWLCRKCHMVKDGRILIVGRYPKNWAKGWETRRKKYGVSGKHG